MLSTKFKSYLGIYLVLLSVLIYVVDFFSLVINFILSVVTFFIGVGIYLHSFYFYNRYKSYIERHGFDFHILKNLVKYFIYSKKRLFFFTFFTSVLVFLFYAFFLRVDVYDSLSDDEIFEIVKSDMVNLDIYLDGLDTSLDLFIDNSDLLVSDFETLTIDEKDLILNIWASYLDYSREINLLVQKHNYYGQIDSKNILNLKYDSFLISYLGYLSIWNSVLDLRELVNDNIDLKVFLNEENSELNIYYNSYFETLTIDEKDLILNIWDLI